MLTAVIVTLTIDVNVCKRVYHLSVNPLSYCIQPYPKMDGKNQNATQFCFEGLQFLYLAVYPRQENTFSKNEISCLKWHHLEIESLLKYYFWKFVF